MIPGTIGVGVIVASLSAGIGSLFLVQYLLGYRDTPGVVWFIGNISAVAAFCLSYGVSLLVFDPTVRFAFEVVSLVSLCCMGPFFVTFALEYTGYSDVVGTPLFGVVFAAPVVTAVLSVTNGLHGLVWTDFHLAPVFGLATVTYRLQPWGVMAVLFSGATGAMASSLLVGAIVGYGPLYRREATAVALSVFPPVVGVSLWLLEIGPPPQLHITAPLMTIHVVLDAFAFVGTPMFETNPTTQRAAERSALSDLNDPLLVVDTNEQVVNLNDAARRLFGVEGRRSLPVALESLVGVELDELRDSGEITVDGTFAVSYTPLTDSKGNAVGGMLVLYDVTLERRREQQLAVLNRILRHNLRNEMTVIRGYAGVLESEVESPRLADHAEAVSAASDRVLSITDKVRRFKRIQERETRPERCDVVELLDGIDREFEDRTDEVTIERTVAEGARTVRTDATLLSLILSNLVENAVGHADSPDPTIRVRVSKPSPDGPTEFEIRDDNEAIPDIEIAPLLAGEETALQHGRGVGLWVVQWCVELLDGDVTFEYDDGNVVTVRLPDIDVARDDVVS